ncbi:hypothetical protein FM115_11285 [Marinilactibacillus psychrotolerans 42ea]|uniref:Uncharacterized protein n=1 Tax=Marinilactibacillus psychrotolerans 42ea TaxID=1255609 RepID=A0A1R4KNZ6_9LACT|nr:hypothetical protein FM115_11285 [Marinilactibacillus psychrotolerans 42ea]
MQQKSKRHWKNNERLLFLEISMEKRFIKSIDNRDESHV